MNNYIQEFKNSLSPDFCQRVIELFESEPVKQSSVVGTQRKFDINIKNSMEYLIPLDGEKNESWINIEEQLVKELQSKLLLYIKNLEVTNYNHFKPLSLLTDYFRGFNIVRYIEKCGHYAYHHDQVTYWESKKNRVLTYIWYLNDVSEGGETEFWGNYKIKPEVGKLVFFPTTWTFPHCGTMPISNNKYIIAGILCDHEKENSEKIISIDIKEKMDALVKLYGGNELNHNESNIEKEEVETFRKSYGRVYYLT